ncbi:erythromycin esterase-like protein [Arcticibacter pallidicorallinus]|uniref:Erythromycin esterase-like protein n=1 Tax=Arcticibacter pallidicorallinus TaxID=1259464 RepID=A0A2T0TUS0_9SPHI|nr:erythromycin esterase family protein [Arcticibacter pallidicorallinus]PRY49452.1 erythromycin esterase-like protein [Arcticibacter pallidicorallinus]
MTYRLFVFFFLVVASLIVPFKAESQVDTQDIVERLNHHIVPIQTFNPDSSFSDISFLESLLKEKEIIALGEGTHGTHEFFRYKDKLIRFLVTKLHFKAIAFESDFAALMSLDDYINGRLTKPRFFGGFPAGKETREILEWLRAYNGSKPEKEKVHIYGLEARGFGNIIQVVLDSISNISAPSKAVLQKVATTVHSSLTKKDIAALDSTVSSLKMLVTQEYRPAVHVHYVQLLEQEIARYLRSEKDRLGMRDKNMFENACWIQSQTDNNKLIIWAHNGHVSKSNIFWQDPLGKHLDKKCGSKYYVIATDMNHGKVGVMAKRNKELKYMDIYYPPVSSTRSYEYYFSKCFSSNFLLDLSEASGDSVLETFLNEPKEMRLIGGTEKPSDRKLSMSKCFDLIAFFDKTTAAGSR